MIHIMSYKIDNIRLEVSPENSKGYSIITLYMDIDDNKCSESIAVLSQYIKAEQNKDFQHQMMKQIMNKLITDLISKKFSHIYKTVDIMFSPDSIIQQM